MNAINWKSCCFPTFPICSLCISLIKSGRRYALRRELTCPARCCRLGRAFLWLFKPASEPCPMDLLIGILGAVLIRLIVYVKGKNAKKYRKGIEYGSARWGTAEDIKPYTDPVFQK